MLQSTAHQSVPIWSRGLQTGFFPRVEQPKIQQQYNPDDKQAKNDPVRSKGLLDSADHLVADAGLGSQRRGS